MPTETGTILAKGIEVTDTHLGIITDAGRFEIPWGRCSYKLANATPSERSKVELSPAGYGIHWPLLDEDLAVGPLIREA
jgi:hypothetical protein